MNEDFIHFIWKNSLFDSSGLTTVDGQSIRIISLGFHNAHAGPDFLDARIQIGEQTWAGHVEIHILSSNWYEHKHHEDEAYENVILHVVLEDNKPVEYHGGAKIPTLEIKRSINWDYYNKYQQLVSSRLWVPCAGSLGKIEPLDWTFWVNRLSIARLERKTGKILTRLNQNKGDWEETLYQLLAESFGFKVNAEAFILLAESLPLNTLKRHGDDLFQLEALLLGQAGFLSEPSADPYINRLHNEYSFLSTKFNLYHLNAARIWKRFRMMPRNFPEIRIVQFAALLFKLNNLVTSLAEFEEAKDLFSVLHVKASSFWDGHYTMERISTPSCKKLGRTSIEGICINTIAPFVFCMGRYKGDLVLEERAITLLESCRPEKNQITKNWKRHGFVINNACESQGSIELKNEFCANKKCLDCVIGTKMLKTLNENG